MISRTLLVAALGLTLAGGTVASAKLATPMATKAVATKTLPAKTTATKTVTTKVINGKHVRTIAGKHHRFLVSHRGIKRVTVAKTASGKRLVVSHVAKRIIRKHA